MPFFKFSSSFDPFLFRTVQKIRMEVIKSSREMNTASLCYREAGKSIGFVPTMGALHEGHLALVRQASAQNEVVIVSIFVNPTQFNNPDDFRHYPRMIEEDLEKLEGTGCTHVFIPSDEDVYPEGKSSATFDLAGLDKMLEGSFRPGHFQGVADVVSRLFAIVSPHRAYFGLKDFQQVKVIRQLVSQLNLGVEVVPCLTLREPDGLAMSSRNLRLSAEERKAAAAIYQSLLLAARLKKEGFPPAEVKKAALDFLGAVPLLRPEYFEIVDESTLEPLEQFPPQEAAVACAAVYAGEIRLIDNIYL